MQKKKLPAQKSNKNKSKKFVNQENFSPEKSIKRDHEKIAYERTSDKKTKDKS